MAYKKVKEFFNSKGLGERVVIREQIGDTVEHAAKAIGCEPACTYCKIHVVRSRR